jgi:branched-chain amino acid aminotransferase/4-amino-4-deoxychorismate lyase
MIPQDDRGLLLGDGLFETILSVDGALDRFEEHLDRMVRGCAVLGLSPPAPEKARQAAERALSDAGLRQGRAAVRLTLTAGSGRGLDRAPDSIPRLLASAAPAPAPKPAVTLATVGVRRNERSPASRLKTLSYVDNVLARAEARAKGADEALMLNTSGELGCAAAANLFWISGRGLFTPALDCGVLDGIVRAALIRADLGLEAVEVHAGPEALESAEAVFLTNSLIGVQAVTAVDGRSLAGSEALVGLISGRRA